MVGAEKEDKEVSRLVGEAYRQMSVLMLHSTSWGEDMRRPHCALQRYVIHMEEGEGEGRVAWLCAGHAGLKKGARKVEV